MESDPSTGGRGFGTFLIVWIGQLDSVLGSVVGWLTPRVRLLEIEVPDALEDASR